MKYKYAYQLVNASGLIVGFADTLAQARAMLAPGSGLKYGLRIVKYRISA